MHSDINHCYAQLEEMKNPRLRNIPMAVGGSVEKRNGIILAKNDLAREYHVRTGETLRAARLKCPDLVIIHPHYDDYVYYTEKIKNIYRKYTDQVESFGLDEAWIDLTHSQILFGDGIELAKKIQDEVYDTFGVTVSMGVSFNKAFAKLASDMLKHKGFVVIDEDSYKEMIWPRDVEDLLMVGSRTRRKLNQMGIFTVGQLAEYNPEKLYRVFGVIGNLLWRYANGLDDSEVHESDYKRPVKSIGSSKTAVKDICSMEQLQEVLRVLAESCAARLRQEKARGKVISIYLRSVDLKSKGMQMRLSQPTDLASEILAAAMRMVYRIGLEEVSLRSAGIHVSDLCRYLPAEQLDLFSDPYAREKQRAIEECMYQIRLQYGYNSCRMASSRVDADITDFDPMETIHKIHPVGVLEGPIRS